MTATPLVTDDTFRAMGTDIELVLIHEADRPGTRAAAVARQLAEDWEATFSRFRPDSELSTLNSRAGEPVRVTPRLYAAVEAALDAGRLTGGLFNPLVLPNLVSLGYDRTFEDIAGTSGEMLGPSPVPDARLVQLDPVTGSVTLPEGTAIDLGGIAKGLYVDELFRTLTGCPAAGIISAGGDMRVWGRPPGEERWTVGLEDPEHAERDLLEIGLRDGAIATSGTNRRSWIRGHGTAHHLIDPLTGMPATALALSITVVADSTASADVLATALFAGNLATALVAELKPLFALAIVVQPGGHVEIFEGGLELDVTVNEVARN